MDETDSFLVVFSALTVAGGRAGGRTARRGSGALRGSWGVDGLAGVGREGVVDTSIVF